MTTITVVAVPWDHDDAVTLRAAMTAEMTQRYADRLNDAGVPVAFAIADESIAHTALAFADGVAVGHLALRWLDDDLEIKRVYVTPAARGMGVARALLDAAEQVARELGAARLVLQTGDRQPDAVRLYETTGYVPIPVFPPYEQLRFSLCFAKPVTTPAVDGMTRRPC